MSHSRCSEIISFFLHPSGTPPRQLCFVETAFLQACKKAPDETVVHTLRAFTQMTFILKILAFLLELATGLVLLHKDHITYIKLIELAH